MSDVLAVSLSRLESELSSVMHPVDPPPAFKGHLQHRISSPIAVTVEEQTAGKAFLVVSLGLFTGVLVLWFSRLLRVK